MSDAPDLFTPSAAAEAPITSPATLAILNGGSAPLVELRARIDGKEPQAFHKRFAEMLGLLVRAGSVGVTSRDLPAGVRVSHLIWGLRRDGVSIATATEPHGGVYAGSHGRYVLGSRVEVLSVVRAGEKGRSAKGARHAA